MINLSDLGWNDFHQQYLITHSNESLSVGRVSSVKGFKYYVYSEKGVIETELSGKLLFATAQEDLPKVGDWVVYMDYETMGYVISIFPRKNELVRKDPGAKSQRQVLATNIDAAFVVQSLDNNFNLMRLERYLVQLAACGIKGDVILNKSDLISNPDYYREEVARLGRDCKVHLCSAHTHDGVDLLIDSMGKSFTYILIGSSGVGKSSLLNYLMKMEVQQTLPMSAVTGKGMHTTTTRDLFRLPNGALVIDTPGMREFGATFEEAGGSEELYPLIEKFAKTCRFTDCTHIKEAGCGVLEALEKGELGPEAYQSYIKLIKEQRRFELSAEDKKRFGKQSGRMTREANNYRKKYKF